MPSRSWRSCSRFSTCARTDTSSAATGSSATMSFGFERQRPGDGDALALAARELGRIPLASRRRACRPRRAARSPCARSASTSRCARAVRPRSGPRGTRGSSEPYGSWNTICMPRALRSRSLAAERGTSRRRSAPSRRRARSGAARAGPSSTSRLRTPDEGEACCPRSRVKLTSSTAVTQSVVRPSEFALGREPLREALDLEQAHTLHVRDDDAGQPAARGGAQAAHVESPSCSSGGRSDRTGRAGRAGTAGGSGNRRGHRRGDVPRDVDQAPALPRSPGSHRADPRCTGAEAGRRRPRRSPAPLPGPRTSPPRGRRSRRRPRGRGVMKSTASRWPVELAR